MTDRRFWIILAIIGGIFTAFEIGVLIHNRSNEDTVVSIIAMKALLFTIIARHIAVSGKSKLTTNTEVQRRMDEFDRRLDRIERLLAERNP